MGVFLIKRSKGEEYIDAFPKFKKWINECTACHYKGYNPNIPDQIDPIEGSLGSYYIKKYFKPLQLDSNGLCEQCSKCSTQNNTISHLSWENEPVKYYDFIDGINSGTIKKASFSIADYPHYRNCVVESKPTDPNSADSSKIIWFYLTPDGYEKKGFLNKIREDEKLFNIKGKGTFSLKQIWDKVTIHSVEYACNTDVLL